MRGATPPTPSPPFAVMTSAYCTYSVEIKANKNLHSLAATSFKSVLILYTHLCLFIRFKLHTKICQ